LIDLIVVLFLVTVLMLVLLMAMPRGREQARLTGCQRNLAQIGLALALYDQIQHQLPMVDRAEPIDHSGQVVGQHDEGLLFPSRHQDLGRFVIDDE